MLRLNRTYIRVLFLSLAAAEDDLIRNFINNIDANYTSARSDLM